MSKLNPQKASAYVGPGVLRKGGKITPVPNGPLIKKKGIYAGSTLKSGGKIKKAQTGKRVPVTSVSTLTPAGTTNSMKPSGRELTDSDKTRLTTVPKTKLQKQKENAEAIKRISYNNYVKNPKAGFQKPGLSFDDWNNAENERTQKNARKNPEPKGERTFFAKDNGPKSPCKGGSCSGLNKNGGRIKKAKAGGTIKKAQSGETIKGSRKGRVFKTTKERTTSGGLLQPYKYTTKSIDTTGYSKGKPIYELKSEEGEGDKTFSKSTSTKVKKVTKKQVPSILKDLNKGKNGNMIKRADGSYSKRGLWDNIRANKGSGKKPTKQMLQQEKKIKAKTKK